jgi:glycine/D-amino acid oxidase-like deaminating enzyme
MNKKIKTVIVGSGILGACHAFTFSKSRNVFVFDVASGPSQNLGTGASSACIRRHYSHPELTLLASYAFNFIENLQAQLPNLCLFNRTGCLSLADSKNMFQGIYRQTFEKTNIPFIELPQGELANKFDQLKITNFETGIYDEFAGYADPHGLTSALVDLAKINGARFSYNTKVTEIQYNESKVIGVRTDKGEIISCDEVIIAGSYLTENLLNNSGISIPLPSTSKRPVFTIYAPLNDGKYRGPIFADFTNEIYCKPEANGVLVGSIAAEDEENKSSIDTDNFNIEETRIISLLDRIQRRFESPKINKGQIRIVKGFYDVNDVDWIPIQDQIGPAGLYLSFATSGHGFKLAFPMAELLISQIDGSVRPSILSLIEPSIFNLNNKRINATGVLA